MAEEFEASCSWEGVTAEVQGPGKRLPTEVDMGFHKHQLTPGFSGPLFPLAAFSSAENDSLQMSGTTGAE